MRAIALLTRGYIDPIRIVERVVGQVPIPPGEAQNLLTKALELPLPPGLTEALGVFQSDVIIRTAIVAAIADLRANPWLLDYVFASLPRDQTTLREYGEKEVAQAKKWFLSTNIPVFLNVRVPDNGKPPCITVALEESSEAENTLGDSHYVPREDAEAPWPALCKPFDPISYNAPTGIMVVPESILSGLVLAPGMIVIDRHGKEHEILEVVADDTIGIEPGSVADFHLSIIKAKKPSYVAALESASFKETYSIGCHAIGEPVHLTYIHSILTFALLRYRQALLESRGFERSFIASSDFHKNEGFDPENVFSRYITLSGYVRQYWPKSVDPKVTSLGTQLLVDPAHNVPLEPGQTLDELTWIGEQDGIGTKIT